MKIRDLICDLIGALCVFAIPAAALFFGYGLGL
jgi:hypothetical protein